MGGSKGIDGTEGGPLCSRNARPQKDGGERPGALLARRTRTVKRCSFDARSKGQPWPLPQWKVGESEGPRLGEERVSARSGGRVRMTRAVEVTPSIPSRDSVRKIGTGARCRRAVEIDQATSLRG
jgi:hypothetical protein